MKVVLSPNPYRDRGLRAAQAAEKILRNVGVETAMCLPFLLEGSNLEFPKHIQFKDTQEELKNADMLVCFGGDGTILHAAKDANAHMCLYWGSIWAAWVLWLSWSRASCPCCPSWRPGSTRSNPV